MENLEIYNKARCVPPAAIKTINAGRLKGFSDINPMWRIKKLTELFGACGVGWWYEVTDKSIVYDELTNQKCAFVDILLYYKTEDGTESHGVYGTGGASFVANERNGAYMSDECFKMALTDAISVAAKNLGLAADIYYEKDKTKYITATEEKQEKKDPPQRKIEPVEIICHRCGNALKPVKGKNGNEISVNDLYSLSQKNFDGAIFCAECQRLMMEERKKRGQQNLENLAEQFPNTVTKK